MVLHLFLQFQLFLCVLSERGANTETSANPLWQKFRIFFCPSWCLGMIICSWDGGWQRKAERVQYFLMSQCRRAQWSLLWTANLFHLLASSLQIQLSRSFSPCRIFLFSSVRLKTQIKWSRSSFFCLHSFLKKWCILKWKCLVLKMLKSKFSKALLSSVVSVFLTALTAERTIQMVLAKAKHITCFAHYGKLE